MSTATPGWQVRLAQNTDDVHVVPLEDLIDHIPDECPCGSTDWWDEDSGRFLVVHHSLDGREQYETPEGTNE